MHPLLNIPLHLFLLGGLPPGTSLDHCGTPVRRWRVSPRSFWVGTQYSSILTFILGHEQEYADVHIGGFSIIRGLATKPKEGAHKVYIFSANPVTPPTHAHVQDREYHPHFGQVHLKVHS